MPNMPAKYLRDSVSNIDLMNAIRKNATVDYQRRIPDVTKASYKRTIENLLQFSAQRNEFVDVLINRIGLTIFAANSTWNNPLAHFKRGLMQYGETIEEIMVGLIDAYVYDPDRNYLEGALFGQHRPEAQTSFHQINRQNYYPITINQDILARAFLSEDGLSSFVNQIMIAPNKSDQWDEYLSMANLFREYYDAGGFFKVQVADFSSETTTQADAQYFLKKLREYCAILPFISRHYNAAGMPVSAPIEDLELFLTPSAQSSVDVQALAAAFNVDYATFPSRSTVLPSEHFNIPGVQAILTTRDFFVAADNKFETTSAMNPVGLYNNYFLHHWSVISASRFVPAILFTTEESTVIELDATPVTSMGTLTVQDQTEATVTAVQRGELYQVNGEAVTTPSGGWNDQVILSIAGTGAVAQPLSALTRITQAGVLYVGPDEPNEQITITATAADNETIVGTEAVTVEGDLLTLWPDPNVETVDANNGLKEATPTEPAFEANVITIPTVTGVQYSNGATPVNNGSEITVSVCTPVTINAAARTGYELTAGANNTWTFTAS